MGFWDSLFRGLSDIQKADHQRKMLILQQLELAMTDANIKYSFGEFQAALAAYKQALALAQLGDAAKLQIMLYERIGRTYIDLAEPSQALIAYHQGLDLAKNRRNHEDDVAQFLFDIGEIHFVDFKQYNEALEFFNQALPLFSKIKKRKFEGLTLKNIGHVYFLLENYQQARTYFSQALTIFRELDNKNQVNALQKALENLDLSD